MVPVKSLSRGSYWIDPEARGRGFAPRALITLTDQTHPAHAGATAHLEHE
jgi:hypothetical protein